MRKLIYPFLSIIAQMILMGFLVWIWEYVCGDSIVRYRLIIDAAMTDSSADTNVTELKDNLAEIAVLFWIFALIMSSIWLLWSNYTRMFVADDVIRSKVWWWIMFVGGAILAIIGGYIYASGQLENLRKDLWVVVFAIFILIYIIFYWCIGSWGFTRWVMRPAVPFATWFNSFGGKTNG